MTRPIIIGMTVIYIDALAWDFLMETLVVGSPSNSLLMTIHFFIYQAISIPQAN